MKNNLPQPTEHQIQNAIIGYLRAKGYYVQRINSGGVRVTNKYGASHIMRLAAAGTPDLMAFKMLTNERTQLLFVEVKRPGNKPTPLQLAKMEELEEYGARCIVTTGIDDLEKQAI